MLTITKCKLFKIYKRVNYDNVTKVGMLTQLATSAELI